MTATMEMFDNNAHINMQEIRSFSSLPKEAWEYIDGMLIRVAKETLVGIRDLNSRPKLVKNINGMSLQVYTINRVSEMGNAKMAIAPDTRGENGALDFDTISVPMVVTYKDFIMNAKQVAMASRANIPFDTTMMEEAVRSVARKLESTLFNGEFNASGHTVYGYTTYPNSIKYPVTGTELGWDTANPEHIFDNVNEMVELSIANNHNGPWILYIPRIYQALLNQDYINKGTVLGSQAITAPSFTIRQRLMQIEGLEAVTATNELIRETVGLNYEDQIVLVEMRSDTVELINGLPLTVGDWEPTGTKNWNHHFKALTMSVPLLKSDYNGQTGIVLGTLTTVI